MPRSNSTSYPSLFASHYQAQKEVKPISFIVTGENPFEYIGKAVIFHNTSVCRVKQVGAKQTEGNKEPEESETKFQPLCAIVQLQ